MITSKQVADFKESFCDENKIIPNLLKDNFKELIKYPLLDVGSGLGDISSVAFGDKEVIHIDTEDYSFYKIPEKHTRIIDNFFTYQPNIKIETLLLSHVLQFIDDNVEKLNKKIKDISPDYIIIVRNTNNDFMGELMKWFDEQNINSNPEKIISNFPVNYKKIKNVSFVAELKCPSYKILSEQISYLWDTKLSDRQNKSLKEFLEIKLPIPSFQIHQEIVLFKKS
jgi:hypothetical protein